MLKIETAVTGDVREHHFRCIAGHEFSVLAKQDLEIAGMLSICVVDGCYKFANGLGENAAAVSTDATDLLTH